MRRHQKAAAHPTIVPAAPDRQGDRPHPRPRGDHVVGGPQDSVQILLPLPLLHPRRDLGAREPRLLRLRDAQQPVLVAEAGPDGAISPFDAHICSDAAPVPADPSDSDVPTS